MRATMKLSHTARSANTKANAGVNSVLEKRRIDSAAPKLAPDDTPRIPWLTRGFWKRPWKAHPLAASAAPTSAPVAARGRRLSATMETASLPSPKSMPKKRCASAWTTSTGVSGKRPTQMLSRNMMTTAAIATAQRAVRGLAVTS